MQTTKVQEDHLIHELQVDTLAGAGGLLALIPATLAAVSSFNQDGVGQVDALRIAYAQLGVMLCCVAAAYWNLVRNISFTQAKIALVLLAAGIGAILFYTLNSIVGVVWAVLLTPVAAYTIVQWRGSVVQRLISGIGSIGADSVKAKMGW